MCTNSVSCALNPSEMGERLSAWRAVSSRAVSRENDAGRITSVYPSDPDVTTQLKELIAAEALCCSFLNFEVEERDGHTVVELTFPEEARPLVESVLANGPH